MSFVHRPARSRSACINSIAGSSAQKAAHSPTVNMGLAKGCSAVPTGHEGSPLKVPLRRSGQSVTFPLDALADRVMEQQEDVLHHVRLEAVMNTAADSDVLHEIGRMRL